MRNWIVFFVVVAIGMGPCRSGQAQEVRWSSWDRAAEPVSGVDAGAVDPSVVRDGTDLRMVFTVPEIGAIAEVVSSDGSNWAPVLGGPVVFEGVEGAWDEEVGAGCLVPTTDGFELFYRGSSDGDPAAVGRAVSTDGVHFERTGQTPILEPTPGGLDGDGFDGPTVVRWNGRVWMVVGGECGEDCGSGAGVRILGAESAGGTTWSKRERPVLEPDAIGASWAEGGVGDPALIEGPDGLFYLFFTGIGQPDDASEVIGVARSPHPMGPWEIAPSPIVVPGDSGSWDGFEVGAPTVVIEDGVARMWFEARATPAGDGGVGYAEASWPLMEVGTSWQRRDDNPVARPFGFMIEGETDFSLSDPCVIYDEDEGMFRAWWTATVIGLYGPDGPVVNGIRWAESPDGVEWTVGRDLAMTNSLWDPEAWDFTHSIAPFIVVNPSGDPERRYLMFYAGGNIEECSSGDEPCFSIGLATSPDGRHFARLPAGESPYDRAGLVLRAEDGAPGPPDVAIRTVGDPTLVVEGDGSLNMWMTVRTENAAGETTAAGIAHAVSPDGIRWTVSADNPLPGLEGPEGSGGARQPSVLFNHLSGRYEMWFTADGPEDSGRVPATLSPAFGFRHATSPDGVHWATGNGGGTDFRWDPAFASERWGLLTGVDVLLYEGEFRLYAAAWSAIDVPDYFTVPTQAGTVDAISALILATRPAVPEPRLPAGRSSP